jgi:hypothetical protein
MDIINFCNSKCLSLNSINLKNIILNSINMYIKPPNYILNQNDLNKFKNKSKIYLIPLLDNIFYLYLTIIHNKKYCFFINYDKKIFYYIRYRFKHYLFKNNTLFIGNLIQNKQNKFIFYINNYYFIKEQHNLSYITKYNNLKIIINNDFIIDNNFNNISLKYINIFNISEITKIKENYQTINCKGIIFIYENKNYIFLDNNNDNTDNDNNNDNTNNDNTDNDNNNDNNNDNTNNDLDSNTNNNTIIKLNNNLDNNLNNNSDSDSDSNSDNDSDSNSDNDSDSNSDNDSDSNSDNDSNNNSDNDSDNDSDSNSDNDSNNNSDNDSDNDSDSNMIKNIKNIKNIKKNTKINTKIIKVFLVEKTNQPDIYNIYCKNENNLFLFDIACVPTIKNSIFLKNIFKKNIYKINMECEYYEIFNKWLPIKKSILKIDTKKNIINSLN